MKFKIIKNAKSGIAFIDFLFLVVIAVVVYAAYIYVPLVYKSQELETIVKDYTFKTGGAQPEKIQQAIVEDAKSKLGITVLPDDIIVIKNNDRTKIEATWRPVIDLPFGYKLPRVFTVEYDRKQLY